MSIIPVEFRKQRLAIILKKHQTRLAGWQSFRLYFGLATLGCFFGSQLLPGFKLELVALFLLLPIYFYLLLASLREKQFTEKLARLAEFYRLQGALNNGEPLPSEDVSQFPDPNLCRDLDLNEVFAYLDTTLSQQGQWELKRWLCGERSPFAIHEVHRAIKALALFPGPLRKLQCLYPKHKIDLSQISHAAHNPFVENPPLWRWLLVSMFLISIVAILTGALVVLKFNLLTYILLTLVYLQSTHSSFTRAQELLIELESLDPVFIEISKWQHIELTFAPSLNSPAPSQALKTFRRYVALMSLRANPILFYLINFLLPWTLITLEFSERARRALSAKIDDWNRELVNFDGLSSLTNLYLYQTQTLPMVGPDSPLDFTGLRHPLLTPSQVIANDFPGQQQRMFLITGSNMSGKSTFLRAVGINYCLAHMGAPVFAQTFSCPPLPIMTCIRVSDSLRDGRSYFYSEVKRLKSILEQALQGPLFFLIDEPLKGTNNQERLRGNQAFLARLLATQSFGFIATHDLELTKLADHISGLKNFHFTEVWRDNDLYFDYKIKSGPSQSTNALKIMEKEGLLTIS